MVERFNRSLLQLLRAYVDKQSEWERYLPLVLYAYRTSVHSSTGVSPFLLMYGRNPSSTPFSKSNAFDSLSYPAHLQAKFAELHDFVEANLAEAAQHQKHAYDQHTSARSFSAGDSVWLSVPTAGKLDPRWEGDWVIKSMKSPITMEITNGKSTKVVHMNRLQHRNVPSYTSCQEAGSHTLDTSQQWNAPTVDHMYLPPPPPVMPRRYPQRQRRAPDRFGF